MQIIYRTLVVLEFYSVWCYPSPQDWYYALGVLIVEIRAFSEYKRYGLMCVFFRLLCVDWVARRHGYIVGSGGMPPRICCLDWVARRHEYHGWIGLHAATIPCVDRVARCNSVMLSTVPYIYSCVFCPAFFEKDSWHLFGCLISYVGWEVLSRVRFPYVPYSSLWIVGTWWHHMIPLVVFVVSYCRNDIYWVRRDFWTWDSVWSDLYEAY